MQFSTLIVFYYMCWLMAELAKNTLLLISHKTALYARQTRSIVKHFANITEKSGLKNVSMV